MNKKAFREVEKFITKEARHLNMASWLAETDKPCGTTCCLAGAAYLIKNNQSVRDYNDKLYPGTDKIIDDAKQFLGIDESESQSLFFWAFWPEKFRREYIKARGQKGRAAVVVRRIEYFIKTRGA